MTRNHRGFAFKMAIAYKGKRYIKMIFLRVRKFDFLKKFDALEQGVT